MKLSILSLLLSKEIELGYPYHENITFSECYQIIKQIYKGSSSHIYEVKHRDSKRIFVAKVFLKASLSQSKISQIQVANEIAILNQCDHPNIIKLEEVFEDDEFVYVVMEYLLCGDLLNYMKKKKFLKEEEALFILKQILFGMAYLKQKKIVHNDLKLENIFLKEKDNKMSPIIGDFGFSCYINSKQPKELQEVVVGTPGYIAPELLSLQTNQSETSINDMFSLGCIFFIMLSGKMPFSGNTFEETLFSNQYDQPTFAYLKTADFHISSLTMDLLQKMLQKNPRKRITVEEALQHASFTQKSKVKFINIKRTLSQNNLFQIKTKTPVDNTVFKQISLLPSIKNKFQRQFSKKTIDLTVNDVINYLQKTPLKQQITQKRNVQKLQTNLFVEARRLIKVQKDMVKVTP